MKLPGPLQVQTVNPGVLRAPTPNAFSQDADAPWEALGNVGKSISGIGSEFHALDIRQRAEQKAEAEKQQRLSDATSIAEGQTEFDKRREAARVELEKSADFSDETVPTAYNDALGQHIEDIVSKFKGSDLAKQQLRLSLEQDRTRAIEPVELRTIAAGKARANDAVNERVNVLAAGVYRDPGSLGTALDSFSGTLDAFKGTVSADAYREVLKHGAVSLATGAVDGYLNRKDFGSARKVLSDSKFDAYLTEAQRSQLTDQVARAEDAAKREAEAKAREAKADAQFRVSADLEDAKAAAQDGEDWTRIANPRDVHAAYGGERGARIVKALNFQMQTGQELKAIALASPQEEAAALAAEKPSVDAGGYAAQASRADALAAAVVKKRAMIAKDPAAFVLNYIPNAKVLAEKAFAPDATPKDMQAYTSALMSEQRRLGVNEADVRPFTVAQADGLASAISTADTPQKRLTAALPILGVGEDRDVRRAIAQTVRAGATSDLAYALEAFRSGNQSGATRIMQATTGPEVKLTGEAQRQVLDKTTDAYSDYDDILRTQSQWTGNPNPAATAIKEADLISRMTAVTGDAKRATADVTGHLKPVMDSRLGAVLVPATVDESALRRALADKRAALLSGDVFASLQIPGAPSVVKRYEQAVAEDMRYDSHWVNVGDRLGLVLPGGQMLSDKNGRTLTFGPAEMAGAVPKETPPSLNPFPDITP